MDSPEIFNDHGKEMMSPELHPIITQNNSQFMNSEPLVQLLMITFNSGETLTIPCSMSSMSSDSIDIIDIPIEIGIKIFYEQFDQLPNENINFKLKLSNMIFELGKKISLYSTQNQYCSITFTKN